MEKKKLALENTGQQNHSIDKRSLIVYNIDKESSKQCKNPKGKQQQI